jgi:CheY-like chemotaxis protein
MASYIHSLSSRAFALESGRYFLEAQRKAVADILNGGSWQLVKEFVEVESGMSGDREKAIEAGCNDYDTKPVELDRLIGKIECLLGTAKDEALRQAV